MRGLGIELGMVHVAGFGASDCHESLDEIHVSSFQAEGRPLVSEGSIARLHSRDRHQFIELIDSA